MLEFLITVDPDIIDAWADVWEESPRTYAAFIEGTIQEDVQRQVALVNQYPGPSQGVAGKWASDAQRKFVMGFVLDRTPEGEIIPYERTGTYWDTFSVVWEPDEFLLAITNFNPIDQFVTGDDQQLFHTATGWPVVEDEYLDIILNTQDNLIDGYITVIDIGNIL